MTAQPQPSPVEPDEPFRIVMVCLGNICRSPMAEVVLRAKLEQAGLGERVLVESAGTGGWHDGRPADPRTRQALRHRGYDGDSHRARQIQPEWFERYDLILAMDRDNQKDLLTMATGESHRGAIQLFRVYDPDAPEHDLDVPDPYYGDDADFGAALAMIEQAADGLVQAIQAELDDGPAGAPALYGV